VSVAALRDAAERALLASPPAVRAAAVNVYGWKLARDRFGPPFAACRAWLAETERWSAGEIAAFQEERLRRILAAARAVPYWQAVPGIEEVATPADLARLPLLTKATLRERGGDLVGPGADGRRVVRERSSGTTGHRVEFLLPRLLAWKLNTALLYRFYGWAGVGVGDRRVTLGGRVLARRPPYWVHNRAENQLVLAAEHLNETTVDAYADRIRAFAPVFVAGHPSVVAFVAARLRRRREVVRVRAVFTTGETLDPAQREDIETAFGCRVFESYGQTESVVAAFECEEHRGFHDAVELGITELVPDPSGLCGVVGTSLWNDVMPFLRWRTDDLVEPVDDPVCPCGRGLPLRFRRVVGREDDVLRDADGRTVLPVAVRMLVKPWLRPYETYQAQQVGPRAYRLLLAGGDDGGEQAAGRERGVQAALRDLLGAGADVRVERVERIETSSLKARTVVDLTG
jgi:phenylacetate-coenzyme A ligase PaaK-like adenylate-forming protein